MDLDKEGREKLASNGEPRSRKRSPNKRTKDTGDASFSNPKLSK